MTGYTGIDSSAEALGRAGEGRPGDQFLLGTLAGRPLKADLTLCLELLGHQTDSADYRGLVENLWQSAVRGMVVRGPEKPARGANAGIQFHEPLSETLVTASPPGCGNYPVGTDSEMTTFVVLRPPALRHPRDYSPTTLAPLIRAIPIRTCCWRFVSALGGPSGSIPTTPPACGSTLSWPNWSRIACRQAATLSMWVQA